MVQKQLYQPNDLIAGHYRVIKKIGTGGMNSTIYLAQDIAIHEKEYFSLRNKYVAIKVINRDESITDDDWMKFLDECVTATRVTNKKNIVQTYDVVKSNNDNTVSIFMEYIDGISLREYIETHGYLSLNDALFYFQKILEGVKELHSFNDKIIHRDLKPENILLSKDLRNLKIIDFGISSVFTMVNKDNKLMFTNENVIYGTYPYICPDLLKLRGTNDDAKRASIISEQFDFYSLGVILYEMLAAEKPFYAKNYDKLEVIELPLKYDLMVLSDINPHIPVAIENIIFRCMASKPEDIKYRYENINQIITDLNRYLNQPEKTVADHLLKPRNKRLFQIKGGFNIQGQKLREKFYEKTWFFSAILITAFTVVIMAIIIICFHVFEW